MNKRDAVAFFVIMMCATGLALALSVVPATPVSVSWDEYTAHESSSVPHAYVEYRLVQSPPGSTVVACAEQEVDTGLDGFDAPGSGNIPVPDPEEWDLEANGCYGLLEEQTRLVWRTEGEPPIYGIPLPDQVDRGDGWIFQQLIDGPDEPLAGLLASFTAQADAQGTVTLHWETVSETDILGFNLYRDAQGQRERLNEALIPGQMPGSPVGTIYEFVDGPLLPGTYDYWLEVVDNSGQGSFYGPAQATVITEEPLAALAASNDSPTVLGSSTTLTATISAGSNVTYTWALGDGRFASGPVIIHTYPSMGVYAVLVTATNAVSLLTATTSVNVIPSIPNIYLPVILREVP